MFVERCLVFGVWCLVLCFVFGDLPLGVWSSVFVACCLLCVVCCVLFVSCSLFLVVVGCSLLVVRCPLFVAGCGLLVVGCWLLFDVYCLLIVF